MVSLCNFVTSFFVFSRASCGITSEESKNEKERGEEKEIKGELCFSR